MAHEQAVNEMNSGYLFVLPPSAMANRIPPIALFGMSTFTRSHEDGLQSTSNAQKCDLKRSLIIESLHDARYGVITGRVSRIWFRHSKDSVASLIRIQTCSATNENAGNDSRSS
jgi:hypothetical protein